MNTKKEELFNRCIDTLTKELPVLRKMTGLKQKDLADILGVSRQTITNIESGTGKMKWSMFLAIMFVFGLDRNTNDYLKTIDIPYEDVKEWLISMRGE